MSKFVPEGFGPRWVRKGSKHHVEGDSTKTTALNGLMTIIVGSYFAIPLLIMTWLGFKLIIMMCDML